MRYFRAKEAEDADNAAFRLYIAKCGEIMARFMGVSEMPDYAELTQETTPVDTRTGEDIAHELISRAGLVVI